MVVDGIRMAADLPRWAPVLLAFIAAEGGEFLLLVSQGAVLTTQTTAQAIIIGLIAWAIAIGSTELQKRANKTEEKIEAALNMPKGSTRQDLENAVKEIK